jgi:uncharacterized membrane protein YcfT
VADSSLADVLPARETWIDVTRGIAMLLVVYNHVCMGLWTAGIPFWPEPYGPIYLILRAVMLPTLLIASGAVIERSLEPGLPAFIRKRSVRLLVPYALWTVILALIYWLCAAWMNVPPDGSGLIPILANGGSGPLQFLLWLLINQVVYALLRTAGLKPAWMILPAAGAALLVRPPNVLADIFATPGGMLLPLVIGACSATFLQRLARTRIRRRWIAGLIAVAALTFVACAAGPQPWWDPSIRCAVGIVGGLCGALIAITIAPKIFGAAFERIGRHSLAILVAHTVMTAGIRILLMRLLNTADMTSHLLLGTVAGVGGPMILAHLAGICRMDWLFNPELPRRNSSRKSRFSSSCPAAPVS